MNVIYHVYRIGFGNKICPFTAVDPSPLLLPNTSGRLAVLGMLYIMYVG